MKKRLKRWTAWKGHLAHLFGRVSDLLPQVFFLHHISRFHILTTTQKMKDEAPQHDARAAIQQDIINTSAGLIGVPSEAEGGA